MKLYTRQPRSLYHEDDAKHRRDDARDDNHVFRALVHGAILDGPKLGISPLDSLYRLAIMQVLKTT